MTMTGVDMEWTGAELIERWQRANRSWGFEGDSGIERLNKLANVFGYKENGFRFGEPILQFIADNPGVAEHILKYIEERMDNEPEFKALMEEELNEDGDDDGED